MVSYKKWNILSVLIVSTISFSLWGQDLLQERIRKIDDRKKSVYLEQGILHNGAVKETSTLKAMRHSYTSERGYERLVFDFTTNELPRVYGHMSGTDQKLYLDFFKTNVSESIGSFGDSKYVESINFFPVESGNVSVEVLFKENVSVEVFYLTRHGRLVIDIKS